MKHALLLPLLVLAAAPARADNPTDDRPPPPAPVDESVSSAELCRCANDGDMDAFLMLRERAFKGDDEAMSLYFWKTDDWWRGSSFFPVTIRSVEPETGYPTDHAFGKAVCEDETPAVTVDGEVVATRGEVARKAIRLHRPTALVAAAFADDFLLEREAKKNGFATAWAFVHEGLDPPTDPDARAFWNGLREDYPNAPSDDARERFLLLDWQTRFAERRNKLLVALREAATIQYAATAVECAPATQRRAAEESHAESAESAESAK